jgi:hypothetical protein
LFKAKQKKNPNTKLQDQKLQYSRVVFQLINDFYRSVTEKVQWLVAFIYNQHFTEEDQRFSFPLNEAKEKVFRDSLCFEALVGKNQKMQNRVVEPQEVIDEEEDTPQELYIHSTEGDDVAAVAEVKTENLFEVELLQDFQLKDPNCDGDFNSKDIPSVHSVPWGIPELADQFGDEFFVPFM